MKMRGKSFVLNTDTTATDVTWTGEGTPDACIVIGTRNTVTNTPQLDSCGNFGVSDFTTQASITWGSDDGVTTAEAQHGHSSSLGYNQIDDNTTSINRSASISAITDGVRLTPQQSGTARAGYIIAIFGGEWHCFSNSVTKNVTQTEVITHGLSGKPNIGIFGFSPAVNTTASVGYNSFGFMADEGTIVQRAFMHREENGGASGQITCHISTTRCAGQIDATGALNGCLELTANNGTSTTFTARDTNITADAFIGLLGYVDENVEIATVNSPNSAATDWNVNDASETPQAVLGFMSRMTTANSAVATGNAGVRSIFFINDDSDEVSASWRCNDGASPTEVDSLCEAASISTLDENGSNLLYDWTNPSFTSDGFDVVAADISRASSTTHLFPMLFIGQTPSGTAMPLLASSSGGF